MKKTIIRLTEADVHHMIIEAAKQLMKEYDRDEWDEYPDYDEPEFNTPTVYFNPETQVCKNENDELEDGLWYECALTVSDYHVENDGIGHYEFWGHPGYDAGHDYVIVDDADVSVEGVYQVAEDDGQYVEMDNPTLSPEQMEIVVDFAIENDMFDI